MQNLTLTVNLKDGTVNNWQNIPLPCPVSTNGCETTSLDAFAYTWEEPKNCILNRFPAKMIQNEESYYIIKGNSSPVYSFYPNKGFSKIHATGDE